jgi:CRP-like cAMP-binding protein
MPIRGSGTGNRLLDRLPKEEYERLVPLLELVPLAAGQDLYDVDDPIPHVYFPKTGMVSLVTLLEDGRQVEAGTIGNEGLVGLSVVLGLDFSTHRVMGQVAGESLRLAVSPFREAVKRSPQFYSLLQRYVALSLRSTAQIVACNALHPVPERLCRWLLMIHDRVGSDVFSITQEFLAEMLGVRRQTISIIAGTLQKAGLITYRRGVVRILNRKGLEEGTCECYEAMKGFYDRMVG